MIRINYDAIGALPKADQRAALFKSIGGALAVHSLGLAMLTPAEIAKASSAAPEAPAVGETRIKSFLTSDRATPYLGQKWAVPSDNPGLQSVTGNIAEFFATGVTDIDLGYQALFADVPGLLGSNQDHFELLGASMGFTWEQRPNGGIVKPRREITESKVSVPFLEYAEGFGILDVWLDYSKWYHVADAVTEFVSKYHDTKASRHYGLITGQGSGIDVAFATDDATTFNKAVAGVLRKCEAKGYALGSNVQVDILVSPENVGRVTAFLDAKRGSPMIAYGTQKQAVSFSVRNIIVTTKVPAATNGYYVVLPGRKLKRGDWKALTIETARDAHASSTDWVGKARYNAIVGDADQLARVLFS